MDRERALSDIAAMMFVLDLCVVLFYSTVRLATTARICDSFDAYLFLASVRQVPPPPWRMPVRSVGLYLLLWAVSVWKDRQGPSGRGRLAVCAVEIGLCVGIEASLDLYYSGVALLALADLVRYVKGDRARAGVMLILVPLYAFGQYEVVSTVPLLSDRIPFSAYLSYYGRTARGILSGAESVMASLNVLLFVSYMILLFTGQKRENARIRRLNEELDRTNARLREYTFELERMTEVRERNRLAREIHDTLGHTLTGIVMGADAASALFDVDPAAAKKGIGTIARTAREGLEDVRRSVRALRPDALERRSLEEALEKLIHDFHLTTSAEIRFQQSAGPLRFAGDEEDTLYRIVQEGMTNAVRHGHATRIDVLLTRRDDLLTVVIRDDGLGCEAPEEGFGLRHMRERLGLLGGSLTYGDRDLDSDDGHRGFFIAVSLPVREREEADGDDPGTDRG